MATATKPKVVSTVKRKGDAPASTKASAKPSLARKAALHEVRLKRRPPKAAYSAANARVAREEPTIYKKDAGKVLADRLNPKLLEQLRTRRVTNTAAAAALGVHETYLCRVLTDLEVVKTKGETTAHRESRSVLKKARTDTRALLAKKANRKEITVEEAAKQANCSVRTMWRYCAAYANLKTKRS